MNPTQSVQWEYTGNRDPYVEEGEYVGKILSVKEEWNPEYGRYDIQFQVALLAGPYKNGRPQWESGQMEYTPTQGFDSPEGIILTAHFNGGKQKGKVNLGRKTKLRRAINAVYDGHPPQSPSPGDLIGSLVRCSVATTTRDSNRDSFHQSDWYSTVRTFLGPAEP